jgi:L-alanine-DL-glutamate epimerase-like enolase superfamily enzyme
MKIEALRTTPLTVPYEQPIHTSYGARDAARVILVEIEDSAGNIGYGESIAGPELRSVETILNSFAPSLIGRDPRGVDAIIQRAMCEISSLPGANLDYFSRRVVAGLDMALWDLAGKAAGVPATVLMGGPLHDDIGYYAFINGDTPEELALEGTRAIEAGAPVIYMKLGRGDDIDIAAVSAVREAIGGARLRLDPNEAWDVMKAIDMCRRLAPFNPEFVEQPVPGHSLSALKQVKDKSPFAIAADQAVHSPADVFACVSACAADIIVLGPHETGGMAQLVKAATIADAAGIKLCIHAVPETQITTCASFQAARSIANIDDANQEMAYLLSESLITAPSLELADGRLTPWEGPGLGFTLDHDAVARAAERARQEGQ